MHRFQQTAVAFTAILSGLGGSLAGAPALAANCPASGAVSVGVAPPPSLPADPQPPLPAYGYVWTPGYWAWNGAVNDYYWSPGVWVLPPAVDLLWTPGYWGWNDGVYIFNAGYWGPVVGFYGGIDYGYGYFGHGYQGGYWQGRTFYYNRAVNRLGDVRVNAAYTQNVGAGRGASRTSYTGGAGGVRAQPTAAELAAGRAAHTPATAAQAAHAQQAALDPGLRAGPNHGHPRLAAVAAAGAAYGAGRLAAHVSAHAAGRQTGGEAARARTAATHGQPHGEATRHAGGAFQGGRTAEGRSSHGFAAPRQASHAEPAHAGARGAPQGHPGGGGEHRTR